MAKLIERIGRETIVDGIPINLSKLVNVGVEIVVANIIASDWANGQKRDLLWSKEAALKTAMEIAQSYGCSYVMLGNNPQLLKIEGQHSYYLFIATFYSEKA